MVYKRIATYSNFFITKPSDTFANIIDILTCCCNNQITRFCFSKIIARFFRNESKCFSGKSPIVGIYLAIMNAANSTFGKVFLLQAIATYESTYFAEGFEGDAVGAEVVD